MTDVKPHFPVIVKYTDWELGAHSTPQEFMNESSWEEIDFPIGVDCIIDVEGRCFAFDQQSCTFLKHPTRQTITAEKLASAIREHFERLNPELLKARDLDTMSVEQLVRFADSFIEKIGKIEERKPRWWHRWFFR